MMSLKKAMDEKKFDSRLIDLHIQMGKITPKEYEDYLKSLQDCQDNAVAIRLEDPKDTNPPNPSSLN